MLKVTEFSHRVITLEESSHCKKALHTAYVTGDHVREGNLVLIEVTVEELKRRAWVPAMPLK